MSNSSVVNFSAEWKASSSSEMKRSKLYTVKRSKLYTVILEDRVRRKPALPSPLLVPVPVGIRNAAIKQQSVSVVLAYFVFVALYLLCGFASDFLAS